MFRQKLMGTSTHLIRYPSHSRCQRDGRTDGRRCGVVERAYSGSNRRASMRGGNVASESALLYIL